MRETIPPIRILPMSGRMKGFEKWNVEGVQKHFFLRALISRGGRFSYPSSGLNAPSGTLVLFQYKARIVASARLLRDEKLPRKSAGIAGTMYFDVNSIRTFAPLDVEAMRKAWPRFRAFGHVKQMLNPAGYPILKRRLKHIKAPA